ncbi:PiggyBac transposable element-derived protein 4, partial [Stegodyphus mimosarum]
MPKRKRGLTEEEIRKLLQELEDENYGDSESDCELDIENGSDSEHEDMENTSNILTNSANYSDEQTNNMDEISLDTKFEWLEPKADDKVRVLNFIGRNDVKGLASQATKEIEFFKSLFRQNIIKKIIKETNRYAEQILQKNSSFSPELETKKHTIAWKDINGNEFLKFLSLTLLMGHIQKDKLKDYWSTDEMLETPFFKKAISRDRLLQILRFLHFEDNMSPPDRNDSSYDRFWKIRDIFEHLKNSFKDVYEPSEELAVDEVIVLFKGRVIFKQYIPKKHKRFGIKIYKLADRHGYTYDMKVYLGRDSYESKNGKSAAQNTVIALAECVKGKGHKLFMDNFFSSPDLFHELLHNYKINSCGTIRCNRKNYPKLNAGIRMQKGQIKIKFSSGMTAACGKDKREVFMLSNMHNPIATYDETDKPEIVATYNKNMGFVDLMCCNGSSKTAISESRRNCTIYSTQDLSENESNIELNIDDDVDLRASTIFEGNNSSSDTKESMEKQSLGQGFQPIDISAANILSSI